MHTEFKPCERNLTPKTMIQLIDQGPIGNRSATVLATSTYANAKRMRAKAERMNMEYGAHRYSVQINYEMEAV